MQKIVSMVQAIKELWPIKINKYSENMGGQSLWTVLYIYIYIYILDCIDICTLICIGIVLDCIDKRH